MHVYDIECVYVCMIVYERDYMCECVVVHNMIIIIMMMIFMLIFMLIVY